MEARGRARLRWGLSEGGSSGRAGKTLISRYCRSKSWFIQPSVTPPGFLICPQYFQNTGLIFHSRVSSASVALLYTMHNYLWLEHRLMANVKEKYSNYLSIWFNFGKCFNRKYLWIIHIHNFLFGLSRQAIIISGISELKLRE